MSTQLAEEEPEVEVQPQAVNKLDLEPCSTCGNLYDKSFHVEHQGELYTFDCFECAIQALAPTCTHCGCRVIGHGVEGQGRFFCCAHCARQFGISGTRDRSDLRSS
jgi:Rieske Fe-S protein